jgi:hypothetical protein
MKRDMDIYCNFGAHNLAITAAGAFTGISNNRYLFLFIPAKYVQRAVFITGAALVAMLIIDPGAIIDVIFIH